MKKDVQSFNNLKVPETVSTFHQQLLEQNNLFITQIDHYLTNINNGKLDPALLDNTDLLQPIQNITEIIEQIQTLGTQVNETLSAGA
jgi:hypothetical protein